MFKEFKEFAIKGNALDLAVGVVIGAAFGSVVNSIVNDLINPILGVVVGRVNFDRIVVGLPGESVLRIGSFLNVTINFLLVAFAIFLIIRQVNRFRRKPHVAPTEKQCEYCKTLIPIAATRCPHCTSQLEN